MFRKHKHFRRTRFWCSYLFGGGFDHPTRGMGGMRSLVWRTRRWKLYTFKGEVSWWEFCKPPTSDGGWNRTPAANGLRAKALEHGQRLDTDIIHDPIEGFDPE